MHSFFIDTHVEACPSHSVCPAPRGLSKMPRPRASCMQILGGIFPRGHVQTLWANTSTAWHVKLVEQACRHCVLVRLSRYLYVVALKHAFLSDNIIGSVLGRGIGRLQSCYVRRCLGSAQAYVKSGRQCRSVAVSKRVCANTLQRGMCKH